MDKQKIIDISDAADCYADSLDAQGKLGLLTWRQAREFYFSEMIEKETARRCYEIALNFYDDLSPAQDLIIEIISKEFALNEA